LSVKFRNAFCFADWYSLLVHVRLLRFC
jgi:hypothetical protein